jgi:hypothetical protein
VGHRPGDLPGRAGSRRLPGDPADRRLLVPELRAARRPGRHHHGRRAPAGEAHRPAGHHHPRKHGVRRHTHAKPRHRHRRRPPGRHLRDQGQGPALVADRPPRQRRPPFGGRVRQRDVRRVAPPGRLERPVRPGAARGRAPRAVRRHLRVGRPVPRILDAPPHRAAGRAGRGRPGERAAAVRAARAADRRPVPGRRPAGHRRGRNRAARHQRGPRAARPAQRRVHRRLRDRLVDAGRGRARGHGAQHGGPRDRRRLRRRPWPAGRRRPRLHPHLGEARRHGDRHRPPGLQPARVPGARVVHPRPARVPGRPVRAPGRRQRVAGRVPGLRTLPRRRRAVLPDDARDGDGGEAWRPCGRERPCPTHEADVLRAVATVEDAEGRVSA